MSWCRPRLAVRAQQLRATKPCHAMPCDAMPFMRHGCGAGLPTGAAVNQRPSSVQSRGRLNVSDHQFPHLQPPAVSVHSCADGCQGHTAAPGALRCLECSCHRHKRTPSERNAPLSTTTSARRCLVHWTPARPVPYIGAVGTHLIVASSSKRPSAFTAAAVTASAAPHADASGAWICIDDEVRRPDRHCSEIRIGDFVALGHFRTFATACACGPSQER